MIAVPPLFAGAMKPTVTDPLLLVAVPIVGAVGTVAGMTGDEGAEGRLVPVEFVAVIVKV